MERDWMMEPDEKYKHYLLDLLAIIHRDGGHYVSEYGLKKAVADAIKISHQRIMIIEELNND